jgi:hypothetical protein
MSTTPRIFVALAAAITLAACGKREPTVVTLKGDSLIGVAKLTFANGAKSADCSFTVNATATGPNGSSATLTKGRVIYTFDQGGDTLMKRPIEPGAVADFFDGKTTVDVGAMLTSKRQGISVSEPVAPLRGSVTFDYVTTSSKDTATTQPYRFLCR